MSRLVEKREARGGRGADLKTPPVVFPEFWRTIDLTGKGGSDSIVDWRREANIARSREEGSNLEEGLKEGDASMMT